MRIAVIEDDVYLRDEITDTFIKRGHSAIGITSFDAAESELEQLAPELIVLDVNLPGRSGFEICRSVKACMSVPVLILTARDTLDDELTALGIGAEIFLQSRAIRTGLLRALNISLETMAGLRDLFRRDLSFWILIHTSLYTMKKCLFYPKLRERYSDCLWRIIRMLFPAVISFSPFGERRNLSTKIFFR